MLTIISCSKQEIIESNQDLKDKCLQSAIDNGKIFYNNDQMMLWGGDSADWSFDITGWTLNSCYLNKGLGRENFPALLAPKYVHITDEKGVYTESSRCIVMHSDSSIKIYPLELMRSHEVINEINNGVPVAVVYCVVADFPAVYNREFCGHVLSFAPTGYTYSEPNVDDGLRAFVLWDRETESLWWPLIDLGVSGAMKDVEMNKLNNKLWSVETWGEIEKLYPNALVLKRGQTMPIPENWSRWDGLCH